MKFNTPLAQKAFEQALNKRVMSAAKTPFSPRKGSGSRDADKFVIRANAGLNAQIRHIGQHQGRSQNSEVVAAILESLNGLGRIQATRNALIKYIGDELAQQVLSQVEVFQYDHSLPSKPFVVRFPDELRDTIKQNVRDAAKMGGVGRSMNTHLIIVLTWWVNTQRQIYALQNAAAELESARVESLDGLQAVAELRLAGAWDMAS